jgi:hypothetical protein
VDRARRGPRSNFYTTARAAIKVGLAPGPGPLLPGLIRTLRLVRKAFTVKPRRAPRFGVTVRGEVVGIADGSAPLRRAAVDG